MTSPHAALAGLKLLLVEDNFLIAEDVRDTLARNGCDVVGPAPRVAKALELVRDNAALDGAVLDVNLGSELCFPIAAALAARGVPFLFLTGYDSESMIPAEFRAATVLAKPIEERTLLMMVKETFAPDLESQPHSNPP
jgi:DNA-binding response OmpR family regulator